MKNLFCKRLGACVCIKQPTTQSLEPPVVHSKVGYDDLDVTAPAETSDSDATREPLLQEIRNIHNILLHTLCSIRDLLETRVESEEEQRYEADRENEMKNDWMLAAAVLDRICAIAVTVIFVVGTVIPFVAFAIHI